uniref:Uncharacterized protein n=1 Tax=Ditylum brightwellii TaxID=49249 RepID=A0A6U3ZXU4_9STRA|mmetsp:Transcript_27766/g.41310  ORF Transcript_27766/g.41310 Transcript_27766/m.41310 type:complete len:230 (+) Transcript_27766:33-722(+)
MAEKAINANAPMESPSFKRRRSSIMKMPEAKRYKCLVDAIHKALSESRKSFDTRLAVALCYGENASIFAGGGDGGEDDATEILANLIDDVLERTNERVRNDIQNFLKNERVNEKLLKIEDIIDTYDKEEQQHAEAEESDRQSARDAAGQSKLPIGVTPDDILIYNSYQIKLKQKKQLLAQIASVEAEKEVIERQIEKGRNAILKATEEVTEKSNNIGRTADICSFSRAS